MIGVFLCFALHFALHMQQKSVLFVLQEIADDDSSCGGFDSKDEKNQGLSPLQASMKNFTFEQH